MVAINPSADERKNERLTAENLKRATDALEIDGFVILEDVVDPGHIATIRDQMLIDVQKLINRPDAPYNWTKGNVQQDPPPFPPYIFADVMSNEFVIQISQTVLGNGFFNFFYSGNTAMPSDQRQPVHADTGQLWPNLKYPTPPFQLVINLPMVDVSTENGSTEIWPGTHVDPSVTMSDGDIKVDPDVMEARRAISPPVQPTMRAGSILIRDIRLWHAGMPNHTPNPRPMVAMIHCVAWLPAGKAVFRTDSESFLKHPILRHHVEYRDEVDHIANPGGFEFEDR